MFVRLNAEREREELVCDVHCGVLSACFKTGKRLCILRSDVSGSGQTGNHQNLQSRAAALVQGPMTLPVETIGGIGQTTKQGISYAQTLHPFSCPCGGWNVTATWQLLMCEW